MFNKNKHMKIILPGFQQDTPVPVPAPAYFVTQTARIIGINIDGFGDQDRVVLAPKETAHVVGVQLKVWDRMGNPSGLYKYLDGVNVSLLNLLMPIQIFPDHIPLFGDDGPIINRAGMARKIMDELGIP